MIKEAIAHLFTLGQESADLTKQMYLVDERRYTTAELKSLPEPVPTGISVLTLGGLIDLIREQVEDFNAEDVFIQVVNHQTVELKETVSDKWGRRQILVVAKVPEYQGFKFGEYHAHEDFMIALQAQFVATDDRDYLCRIAASLTAEAVTLSEDNGVAQSVGIRKGVVLVNAPVVGLIEFTEPQIDRVMLTMPFKDKIAAVQDYLRRP